MKQTVTPSWKVNYFISVFACLIWITAFIVEKRCHNKIDENNEAVIQYLKSENKELLQTIDSLKSDNWDVFIEALIKVESSGIENAVGDDGASIGVLQIQKVYVDELHRKGFTQFAYDDRYSREKSIEMFNCMNPEKDIIIAIRRHNPKANSDYYKKIITQMFYGKSFTSSM